jgi:hypothetical protein
MDVPADDVEAQLGALTTSRDASLLIKQLREQVA